MQILRSVLEPGRTLTAAAETGVSWNLPVNPLSAVLVTLKALNNTATITNYAALAAFFAKLTKLRTAYRGASIHDGDSLDLAMMAGILSKWWWKQGQINDTDNDVRSLTFPLLFGRKYCDPKQCFPATRNGDFKLYMDTAADPTGLDNFTIAIETVELLDASPESFLKLTTNGKTFQSGEANEIELPIGNKLLGCLLRGATYPTGASFNASFSKVALEVDNVEVMISATQWETLQGEIGRLAPDSIAYPAHVHTENTAAAYAQNASTLGGRVDIALLQQYGYLDFDPREDESYALDTKGAAKVNLAITSDVADASASYVMTVEKVDTGTQAAA